MKAISTIVDEIIPAIPQGEPLRDELLSWRSFVFLELPEARRANGLLVAKILDRNLPEGSDLDWQKQVEEIWFRNIQESQQPQD